MPIDFSPQIPFSTEFLPLVDGTIKTYDNVFQEDKTYEVTWDSNTPCVVSTIKASPAPYSELAIRDFKCTELITTAQLLDKLPSNNTQKSFYKCLLGSNTDGLEIKLNWQVKRQSGTSDMLMGRDIISIDISAPNQATVQQVFVDQNWESYMYVATDAYTSSQCTMGMCFVMVPGRPQDLEHSLLFLIRTLGAASGNNQPYTALQLNNYSTDGSTGQRSYNVSPRATEQHNSPKYVRLLGVIDMTRLGEYGTNVTPAISEHSDEAGDPSGPGGMGSDGTMPTFDESSDTIAIPGDPGIGVSNVGFVNVYKTGLQSLQDMGVELFPPLSYTAPTAITATDTMDAIVNGFNSLVTFLANIPSFFDQIMANTLINYVIDCHIIPVTPSGGTTENIKVGYKTLTCTGDRLSNDYVNVSCGSLNIGEFYTNFADFTATDAKLYLPFIGFVSTRPEWFQADTLKVDYKFNIIDGSFTVYVRSGGKYVNNGDSTGTIVAQYGGNACIHLPITGVTYANMVSGLVGAGTGAIAGAASGNIAAAATSAISASTIHGDIAQSNAYNGSAAFLSCRYPFLMIERAVSSYAMNYQHEIGIPANIYATLGNVSGFVQMVNVHVNGISRATDQEKEEIRKLLASGVVV